MRKYPCGAEIYHTHVDFRVWAPNCSTVDVIINDKEIIPLQREEEGYFSLSAENIGRNSFYVFRLDQNNKKIYPDPASRFQPQGPTGPSQIIDPTRFPWRDHQWRGIKHEDHVVIYELHVGTFTPEGTWSSALHYLPHLAQLGITVIEMMPVNEFCGRFNWGYDGVNLFAPTHNYGTPDDLRSFIDAAHRLGIAVILDVVNNHFGPEGNCLLEFSKYYLQETKTEWGSAINFDGPESKSVREYFIANACYWIEEFHFDGLRFDACHAIVDTSSEHILSEISRNVRSVAQNKTLYLTAENEKQQITLLQPLSQGGYGLNSVWNEDFHHTAFVRLTGHQEAHCSDFKGSAQEFVSVAKYGFLYQGQWYPLFKQRRGSSCLNFKKTSFVNFLENHDQVANYAGSKRLRYYSHPGSYRALTAFLLLAPQTPLLFQGQEFGATNPFYYFSEQTPELSKKILEGRLEYVLRFPSLKNPTLHFMIPPPHEEQTFLDSKLNWEEKESNHTLYNLHKDLISLRTRDPVLKQKEGILIDGAVFNEDAFVIRFDGGGTEVRLLLVNLGQQCPLSPLPEPLMAPPIQHHWELLWSSEQLEYGGFGNLPVLENEQWQLSGHCALLLKPIKTLE